SILKPANSTAASKTITAPSKTGVRPMRPGLPAGLSPAAAGAASGFFSDFSAMGAAACAGCARLAVVYIGTRRTDFGRMGYKRSIRDRPPNGPGVVDRPPHHLLQRLLHHHPLTIVTANPRIRRRLD